MKKRILYAVNGTGQGHISRAKSLIPYLEKYVDLDILVSGKMQDFDLGKPVLYNLRGFTFIYEDGGVNWLKTLLQTNIFQFIYDVFNLNLKPYDMIVCDFEPISAWTAFFKRKHCINVSHQSSFFSSKTPRPKTWPFFIFAELFLRFYSFSFDYIGVHFKPYSPNIHPPVLHDDIIYAKPQSNDHISIYLSAFSLKDITTFFQQFPDVTFELFHKECLTETVLNNIRIFPLSDKFRQSIINSSGYITNAGFESTAEALYLEKPLLCIPIKFQYEQYCNGAALKQLGVTVIRKLDFKKVSYWLNNRVTVKKLVVSNTDQLAKAIINKIN